MLWEVAHAMLFSLALLASLVVPPGTSAPVDTVSAAAILGPRSHVASPDATLPPPTPGGLLYSTSPVVPELFVVQPTRSENLVGPRRRVGGPAGSEPQPQLIEYSDAYFTRLTIHKWASYLMLPLFAGEYVVGHKLITGQGSDRLRGVHGALAGGIAGLFAVNTVTGGLNTIEAWKDPEGRTRRTLHSALMLLADVGFVLTGAMASERENEGGQITTGNNNAHRNMAIASMTTAVIGWSIMLPVFGND